jgi:hypothetical protein
MIEGNQINMEYNILLAKLRKDISNLNLKKHNLNENQKSMLDFIEGKTTSSQYHLDNQVLQLTRGNKSFGLEHILNNHYQETSNGKLNAREIINLWTLLEKGELTTDYEQKEKGNVAFRLIKEIKPQITKEIREKVRKKFSQKKEIDSSIDVDIETKKEITDLINMETVKIRLLLVSFEDGKIKRILTYYSDREYEETGDLS